MKWQALPGTADFLEDAVQNLREGTSVAIASSTHAPEGLVDALVEALREGRWRLELATVDGDEDPLRWLTDVLCLSPNHWVGWSVEKMFSQLPDGLAIVIDGLTENNWEAWRVFLRDFELASRARSSDLRPVLAAVIRGVPRRRLQATGAALTLKVWSGVVGELDTMIYVDQSLRRLRGCKRHHKLLVRQIAALALWDFDLANFLVNQPEQDLFDHISVLKAGRDALYCASLPIGVDWEHGGTEQYDGADMVHSIVLLDQGDPHGELARRMWAAQAAELLPLIEMRRRDLVKGLERHVACPFWTAEGQKIESLHELEVGSLAHVARVNRVTGDLRDRAESLARCRNVLAHLGLLGSADALDARLHA